MKRKVAIVGIGVAVFLIAIVLASELNTIRKVSALSVSLDKVQDQADTLEQGVAKLTGRADAADQRAEKILGFINEVGDEAKGAAQTAAKASKRLDAKVQAENRELKKKLAYIRGANPVHKLAKLKDAEVEKLLNDGIWNVEPQIVAAYDELIQNTANSAANRANHAQIGAAVAQAVADRADYTARRAMDAGETAVSALTEISQPTKPLGRSVSSKTKQSISDQVDNYLERWTSAPAE